MRIESQPAIPPAEPTLVATENGRWWIRGTFSVDQIPDVIETLTIVAELDNER